MYICYIERNISSFVHRLEFFSPNSEIAKSGFKCGGYTGNSGAADVGVVVAVSIIGVDYVGNGLVMLLYCSCCCREKFCLRLRAADLLFLQCCCCEMFVTN